MSWIHLNFGNEWGKDKTGFKVYLKYVLHKYKRYINRKFFLFEGNPYLFLALELKKKSYFKEFKKEFKEMITTDTKDNLNGEKGEYFATIMDTITDFTLNTKINNIEKIIHCIINQQYLINNKAGSKIIKSLYRKHRMLERNITAFNWYYNFVKRNWFEWDKE